jgi:MFS family permease
VTQLFQFVLGYSPLRAGVAMMPIAFTVMIVAPLSARIVERFGTKKVVTTGMLLAALGLLTLSRATGDTSYLIISGDLVLLSLGMGLIMPPATEAVMGALPAAKAGVGSAVNDATREVGGALGIAIFGSITASAYTHQVSDVLAGTAMPEAAADAIEHSVGGAMLVAEEIGGSSGAALAEVAQRAFVDGFGVSLVVAAVIVFVGAIAIALSLPARAMDEVPDDVEDEPSEPVVVEAPA